MEKGKVGDGSGTKKRFPRLSGGQAGLDFVNTVEPRIGEAPHDFLLSYTDLVEWSKHDGLIGEEKAEQLLREASLHPEKSKAVFIQAIALREASYRVFVALMDQRKPVNLDLQLLQDRFVQAMAHGRLVAADDRVEWQWEPDENELDQILWLLSRAIVGLLTSPDVERVKECPPGEGGCGWLFVDKSKNRSRRWCSDEECGSLVRMRRMYARRRASKK